jgi:hypothetical protein
LIRTIAAYALAAFAVLAAAPACASPTDDVRAAMLKFAALSSYQLTFGGAGRTGTIDVVKPDAMHFRSQGMEMVRLGSMTYLKAGPQGWTKMRDTSGSGPMQLAAKARDMAKQANGISAATDLGMKNVGGEMLHAYEMKQSDGKKTTIYIGRDGMVHRLDSGSADGTVQFGKFNAVAPIRAPI